jgi:hypothetical protein
MERRSGLSVGAIVLLVIGAGLAFVVPKMWDWWDPDRRNGWSCDIALGSPDEREVGLYKIWAVLVEPEAQATFRKFIEPGSSREAIRQWKAGRPTCGASPSKSSANERRSRKELLAECWSATTIDDDQLGADGRLPRRHQHELSKVAGTPLEAEGASRGPKSQLSYCGSGAPSPRSRRGLSDGFVRGWDAYIVAT